MKPETQARLHIDRLDLDLRGVAPATAQAAVRLLGPALEQAWASADAARGVSVAPHEAPRLDAGRLEAAAGSSASQLAQQIAARLVSLIHGEPT